MYRNKQHFNKLYVTWLRGMQYVMHKLDECNEMHMYATWMHNYT
jgi:hypothetical protein